MTVLGSLAAGAAAGSCDYNEKGGKQRMLGAQRKSNRADSPDSTDANATKKSSNAGKDGSIGAKDEKETEEEQADRDENEVADTESLYSTISQVDDETILERCLQELLQASESMSIDRARLFFLQNIAVMIPYKMIDKHLITAAHMSLSPSQRERLNHMALSTPVLLAKLFLASKMRSQFSVFVLFVAILLLCIETNPVLEVHTLSTIFWIECCCMSVFVYEIIVQRICIQTRLWQAVRNVSSPYVAHIFMLFEVIYESINMRPTSTTDSAKQHIVTVGDDESQLDDNKIKYKYLDTDENRWLWLIIDVLATLPFFVELGIRAVETVQIGGDFTTFLVKLYSWSEARVEIQFLRLFRVVRLFKVGQKSEKLRIIIRAILNATDGIWLLFMTLPLFVIFFAFLLFYAEKSGSYIQNGVWYYIHDNSTSGYQTIYDSLWSVAETVTTVGFGDIYPKTGIGRLVMAIVMFLSFFVIAFPLCMITMEYTHYARLFTEKRRGHEVDARILRERLLASSVSRSSEERENPTAVKNPESVNQEAVTATVQEKPIIEPREEQEMTQSDCAKPKLIITLTEDPIPVSEPETTPLKTPIPDSEPITTKRQFHAPGRSFSSPDFDMTKANSLFSDLDTELDIESDTASIQPHKAGHTESLLSVRPRHHLSHHHNNSQSHHHRSSHHGHHNSHGHHHHVTVSDVENGVSAQLPDGYPNAILLRIQDWKLEYKDAHREDLLTMRIRVKDEKSYRELMKLLADHS
ncbi:voltage-gated potassium channel [Rhizoclosmatium globosum]|uniref:Voltage-gated potassium channel n=1 Tax=Rhizoclosmatium globosum TaxID=329046 RepID=A0A1Y2CVD4_9FUNG|nr:voltage-gated potassium channel [Rhizoclosmatium globosum]|eukprot:ORY50991.1 voltage-gated potassium channel [Rhizoclosmatium globosum]